MSIGKVALVAVALVFASGGVGAALEDDSDDRESGGVADANQAPAPASDGDNTAGNDGTAGGSNTEAAPAPAAPVAAGDGGDSDDSAGAAGAGAAGAAAGGEDSADDAGGGGGDTD